MKSHMIPIGGHNPQQRVETATAMMIVGHNSEKMWKRYNAIEEKDLTQAAQKVHKYLQENTPGTLAECSDTP